MRRFFENKLAVVITVTVAVLIVIGVLSTRNESTVAENVGETVATPVHNVTYGIGKWFGNITNYFGNVKSLKEENEKLKSENTSLQKQINDMQGFGSENEKLKKMLELKEKSSELTMTAASVIAKDPSDWYSSFTVNKGSDDGLEKNQPVVDENRYVVGQISEVGGNWAKVITILDPMSSLGGYIRRSKEIGIVEGDSELAYKGTCRLSYIARDTDIRSGDFVETSGLGGIFPKGLIIGKITDIYDQNATMSKVATIEPMANISKTSEVFVITSYKDVDLGTTYADGSEKDKDKDKNSSKSSRDNDADDEDDDE